MALLSLRKYAEHRGVSLAAVQKAVASGRILVAKEEQQGSKTLKFIDPAVADRMWNQRTDQTQQRVATRREMGREPPKSPENQLQVDLFGELGISSQEDQKDEPAVQSKNSQGMYGDAYSKARSVKETYQAKLAELEFRERAGNLVDKTELGQMLFNISSSVLQSIMNIPSQISAIIHARCMAFISERSINPSAEFNVKEIEDIILGEIRQATEAIADGINI
jgi:hypothetical protein